MDIILKTRNSELINIIKRGGKIKIEKNGKRNEKTKFSFKPFSNFFNHHLFYFKDHKHGLNILNTS